MSKQASKEKSEAKAAAQKESSGKGGSNSYREPSYFESVTGTSDWERQSWRDNFNGGAAAGDWTGGNNARLAAERAANHGATSTGSSTQYSAAEMQARMARLPASVQAAMRGASPEAVQQYLVATAQGTTVGGAKPTGAVTGVFAGPYGNTLAYKPMDLALGGADWRAHPFWSNAEDVETRHGDVGSALYAPFSIAADLGHNAARMYFGADYLKLAPSDRMSILGNDIQAAVKRTAEAAGTSALGAMFGGFDAIEQWGRDNKAAEEARARAAAESDAAWDYRQMLQEQESHKAGDFSFVGSYLR